MEEGVFVLLKRYYEAIPNPIRYENGKWLTRDFEFQQASKLAPDITNRHQGLRETGLIQHTDIHGTAYEITDKGIETYEYELSVRLVKEAKEEEERIYKQAAFKVNQSVRLTNRVQIGSLIVTGLAILGTFFYQKKAADIAEKEHLIHVMQEKERIRDTGIAKQRQELLSASLDSIHKSLDTLSSKIQRRK